MNSANGEGNPPEAWITAEDLLEAACWAERRGRADRALRLLRLRDFCLGVNDTTAAECTTPVLFNPFQP